MTWKGRDPALEITSIDDLRAYIRSGNYNNWRPSNVVVHNTASPTLYQWWNSVPPAQRMENLQSYYENDMGWSSGPHCFIDGKSWWIMTDFWVKGVHSPSWNGTMLGFECVGDYDTESDETGMGAEVMKMAHALVGEVCEYFGWDPNNLKFHKEDPATDHDCPGRNMVKSEFIDDVEQYMGSGGEGEQPPMPPARGVVSGLAAGDTLNIRASASSSSPIIGTAENGDELRVVGEAWNGSTHWLRVQFDQAAGAGVAVFGWTSAAYVTIEGQEPSEQAWRENITATVFGHDGDDQDSAYPDIDWIDDDTEGVSFPYKWKSGPRPRIEVKGPAGTTVTDVVDVGPWNTNDPRYVIDGLRPLAEKQYKLGITAQNGQVPSNDAGIDLTEPIADAVGISGKGKVSWRFVP
jgi:hypothetical protein